MVLVVGGSILLAVVLLGWAPARALAQPGRGWGAALADAALAGLVVGLVGLQVLEAVTWWAAVLVVVGLLVVFALLGRHRGVGLLPAGRPGRWVALAAAVCVAAALLRRTPQVMMAWTGDQGAYIVNAVEFANGATLYTQFPRGFPLYMSVAASLFGQDQVAGGVPLLGVLLVVAVMRLCQVLGQPRWVVLLVGATVAAHPSAVYFSTFPGSEALQAVLTVQLLVLVVGLSRRDLPGSRGGRPPVVAVALQAGLLMFALGVTRISAPVLLLPLLLALVICAAPSLRRHGGTVATVLVGGIAGSSTALLMQLVRSPAYTLRQLGDVVPAPGVALLDRAGLLVPGWPYPVAVLVVLLVVAGWGLLLRRVGSTEPAPGRVGGISWTALALSLAAVALCVGLVRAEGSGEVTDGLARYGWLLVLAALGAPLLVLLGDSVQALGVVLLSWTAAPFVYVHTIRFESPRVHEYFLYWDRYLYSEVFPVAVVMAGCTSAAIALAVARVPGPRAVRAVVRSTVPLLSAALVVVSLAVKADVYEDVFSGPQLEGTASIQAQLQDVLDEDLPLLWGASSKAGLQPAFFPNTWFSLGLAYSRMNSGELREFVYEAPFRADPVITARRVRALACSTGEDAQVAELTTADGVPGPRRWRSQLSDLTFSEQGTVAGEVSWLRQREDEVRLSVDVEITVYRLDHDDAGCDSLPARGWPPTQ